MLKPDALQNIKLSVTSSGPGDKVEIKWGAKNDDSKLSDQTRRIEGSELVLPYVAWKASRGPRHLPISPHISLCLPISPYISLRRVEGEPRRHQVGAYPPRDRDAAGLG